MRAACGVGLRLFAGTLQPSGRSQLQHGVGVASALLAFGATSDLVAAGVVHSAYHRGDFGPWRVLLPQRRAWLRRQLGPQIEGHVHEVYRLPWNPDTVVALPAHFRCRDDPQRNAVFIRLCDELDSIGSGALNYYPCADRLRQEALRKRPALVAQAELLGLPALGDTLSAAVDELLAEDVPPQLRFRGRQVVPPASARMRLEAILARRLAAAARRLRPVRAQASGAPSPRR